MPLANFRCPDGEKVNIQVCLKSCRLDERCLTYPTLILIVAGQREWNGKASVTQLLNGTMLEYLKITSDYTVSPRGRAYSLLGTAHHIKMAKPAGDWITEKRLIDPESEITGILDLLEPDPKHPGQYHLIDYKTYGSYRVAKLLGLVSAKVVHPTEVYKRSGTWGAAGTPKMVTVFHQDPLAVEQLEEQLQLNAYRLQVKKLGYIINSLRLQVTVRDGGTEVARSRGIDQPIYYPIEIKLLADEVVEAFLNLKLRDLTEALANGWTKPCNDKECWDGIRCRDYCDVAEFCPKGQNLLKQNE